MLKQKSKNVIQRYATVFAATLLGSAVSTGTAYAADDESEAMEEIVVTGIRGSMQQSLERKRNADHFVDAITAEDIGAFPDQNLAESLQRISGVAIDRKSGEGAFVSVRGLGPQYVQTTVHGRVAASNVASNTNSGLGNNNVKSRAVSFSAFQSGLVQAVEVHKSPRADHVEGGLGGFIDIQPRRPLDIGKRQAAFSVDATRNELADDTAPGFFAMYSDVLTDNLGFMASAQWDNRVLRTDFMNASYSGDPMTATINGVELSGMIPSAVVTEMQTIDRDRLNVSAALQWQPSDRVEMNVDVLFADNSNSENAYRNNMRHRATAIDGTVVDDNGTGIWTSVTWEGSKPFLFHDTQEADTETQNLGVNLKLQATDNLSVNIDIALSDSFSPIVVTDGALRNLNSQMTYQSNGVGNLPSITTPEDFFDVNHWSVLKNSYQEHTLDDRQSQFRVDATYEFEGGGWLDTVQVGARTYRQDRRDRARYWNSKALINDPIALYGGILDWPVGNFGTELGWIFPDAPRVPLAGLQDTFRTHADLHIERRAGWMPPATLENGEITFLVSDFNEDLNHSDDGNAIYAMMAFSGDFGDTPYSGNVGVRYVDNSTQSVGQVSFPVDIQYDESGDPTIFNSPPEYVDVPHEYTVVLPSLNLRFDPRDDVVVRAALAKVMSRPRFLDLSPRQTVQGRPRTTRGGNGKLDPTVATQFDLGVEWYFADYSILSFGFFTKDMDDFVQSQPRPTEFPGVIDPRTGATLILTDFRPANQTGSSLMGAEITFQHTFADVLPAPFDGLGVIANYTFIESGTDFVNSKTGASYSVPGLSPNVLNFTLFYEKGPWSGRVSYNFRERFLDDVNGGFTGHPSYVEDYDQWDLSLSYKPTDNLALTVEGINLADESVFYSQKLFTGQQYHIYGAVNTGRRMKVGMRWRL